MLRVMPIHGKRLKSAAFHELGHALGLEHPHEHSDGDGDDVIDTNGTVMSYVKSKMRMVTQASRPWIFRPCNLSMAANPDGRHRRRSRDHRW